MCTPLRFGLGRFTRCDIVREADWDAEGDPQIKLYPIRYTYIDHTHRR
jgi:hypothetical protein